MIETTTRVPATRQSVHDTMACEHGYKLVYIDGLKPPNTPPSARGQDVHDALAEYAFDCAKRRIPANFALMDTLASKLGAEAASILEICKESMTIDWQNFYGAEVAMGLTEDFRPTFSYDHDGKKLPFRDDLFGDISCDEEPAYCAILDVINLYSPKVGGIRDYKTHPRPFDPTTFQGKEYPLFLFMHMPELEEIEFDLQFVRYPNIHKPAKYYRSDVPALMEECKRVREHQKDIHAKVAAGTELRVHSGSHCTYCPASKNESCPIRQLNPMLDMSPEDRLRFRLWLAEANRANNSAMKDYVDGTGQEIISQDANGNVYSFGPVKKQKVTFPLFVQDAAGGWETPIVNSLSNWAFTNPDDLIPKRKDWKPWFTGLTIGSTKLKSALKAKARVLIHGDVMDLARTEDVIELRVQRDASVDNGDGEEYRDYGSDE